MASRINFLAIGRYITIKYTSQRFSCFFFDKVVMFGFLFKIPDFTNPETLFTHVSTLGSNV